jgi:hypothetical protein
MLLASMFLPQFFWAGEGQDYGSGNMFRNSGADAIAIMILATISVAVLFFKNIAWPIVFVGALSFVERFAYILKINGSHDQAVAALNGEQTLQSYSNGPLINAFAGSHLEAGVYATLIASAVVAIYGVYLVRLHRAQRELSTTA